LKKFINRYSLDFARISIDYARITEPALGRRLVTRRISHAKLARAFPGKKA